MFNPYIYIFLDIVYMLYDILFIMQYVLYMYILAWNANLFP